MTEIGKYILIAGLILVVLGAAVWGLGKAGFRGLPGDIKIEGENFRFYFPIVTCIVLSVLGTLVLWVVQWWGRR